MLGSYRFRVMIMHSLAGVTISAQWVHRHTAEHIMQNKYCSFISVDAFHWTVFQKAVSSPG